MIDENDKYSIIIEDNRFIFINKLPEEKRLGYFDNVKIIDGTKYDSATANYDLFTRLICIRGKDKKELEFPSRIEEDKKKELCTEFLRFVFGKTTNAPADKFITNNTDAPEKFISFLIDKEKRKNFTTISQEEGKFITIFAPYIYYDPKLQKKCIFTPNIDEDLKLDNEDEQLVETLDKFLKQIKKKVSTCKTTEELQNELGLILSLAKNEDGLAKLFLIWSWNISAFYKFLLWDELGIDLIPILVVIGEKAEGKSTVVKIIFSNSFGLSFDEKDLLYVASDLKGTGIRLKNFGISTFPFIFDDIKGLSDFAEKIKNTATQKLYVERRGKKTLQNVENALASPYAITSNKIDIEEPPILDRMIILPFEKGNLTEEKLFRKLSDEELRKIKNNYVMSRISWTTIPKLLKEIIQKDGVDGFRKLIDVQGELRERKKLQFLRFGFKLLKQTLPLYGITTLNWDSIWDKISFFVENPSKDYIIQGETASIRDAFIRSLEEYDKRGIKKMDKILSSDLKSNIDEGTLVDLESEGIILDVEGIIIKKIIFCGTRFLTSVRKYSSIGISGMRELSNALKEEGLRCLYCNNYADADKQTSYYSFLGEKGLQKSNCIEVDFEDFRTWIGGETDIINEEKTNSTL